MRHISTTILLRSIGASLRLDVQRSKHEQNITKRYLENL